MRYSISDSFLLAVVVSLGGFVFGFDASVISGVVGYATTQFALTVWQQGLLVSSAAMATIVATVTVVPLSDSFGRRAMLICVAVLYTVSAVGSALAPTFAVLVLARAIGGLAFGSLMITPIYVAEIAPPALRGRLVAVNQMNIVVGLSAAYFSNYAIVQLSDAPATWVQSLGISSQPWRWMLGIQTLPALIWLLLLFTVPESPRWLVRKSRADEARKVFSRLSSPGEADAAVLAVQRTITNERARPSAWRTLLHPRLRLVMVIGLILAVAQQATGINAVFFYATSIFELSGVGKNAAFVQAVWVGIINVVFTIVAMLVIDRLGRKPLLLVGLVGIILSLGLVSYGFARGGYRLEAEDLTVMRRHTDVNPVIHLVGSTFAKEADFRTALNEAYGGQLPVGRQNEFIQMAIMINPLTVLLGLLGFVASFAVSLGPVMWVVLSEIFPNAVRSVAMAAIALANALTSWIVQFVFPWGLDTVGPAGAFAAFALSGVVGLVLIFKYVPETKGLSLEELEAQLAPG